MRARPYIAVGGVVAGLVFASMSLAAAPSTNTAAANRARASTEAARLLKMIQLPPGAVASAVEPAGDRRELAQPGYDEATSNLVDAHAWWTIHASPESVIAYVKPRLPPPAGISFATTGVGTDFESVGRGLSPIPGVLSEREIVVSVVRLADHRSAIRTDGEAVWVTPRPDWERIPTGVASVSFIATGVAVTGPPGPTSQPQTLTGLRAAKLVAFMNRLGIVQPGAGARHCPAERFGVVRLRFLARTGKVLASAVESPTGCPFVSLTIGERRGPPLNDTPSVTSELTRLIR